MVFLSPICGTGYIVIFISFCSSINQYLDNNVKEDSCLMRKVLLLSLLYLNSSYNLTIDLFSVVIRIFPTHCNWDHDLHFPSCNN